MFDSLWWIQKVSLFELWPFFWVNRCFFRTEPASPKDWFLWHFYGIDMHVCTYKKLCIITSCNVLIPHSFSILLFLAQQCLLFLRFRSPLSWSFLCIRFRKSLGFLNLDHHCYFFVLPFSSSFSPLTLTSWFSCCYLHLSWELKFRPIVYWIL